MKITSLNIVLIAMCTVLATIAGCSPKEEETSQESPPPSAKPFTGSVDSTIVGNWATKDKKQILTLSSDGNARMQTTVATRAGIQNIDSKMEWKVEAKTISFKDVNAAVSSYEFMLKEDELQLKSPKSLTSYFKQK